MKWRGALACVGLLLLAWCRVASGFGALLLKDGQVRLDAATAPRYEARAVDLDLLLSGVPESPACP
ncbi:MAG: hypothetical protein AB1505_02645 [Candidatus Latescibacterota bacterium]